MAKNKIIVTKSQTQSKAALLGVQVINSQQDLMPSSASPNTAEYEGG